MEPVSPSGKAKEAHTDVDSSVKLEAAAASDAGMASEPRDMDHGKDVKAPAPSIDTSTAVPAAGAGASATKKRSNYLDWDSYFMSLAQLSALRSKDPSTQVGAVLVSREHTILSIGYNGLPRGCSDDAFPWAREADNPLETKYPYVVHAEANAVLNRNTQSLKGATLYVGLFPCNECTKLLIQSGVEEVVFMSDKYHHTVSMTASRKMLDAAGVKYRQFVPAMESLVLDFKV